MSDRDQIDENESVIDGDDNGEWVQWYAARPMTLSTAAMSGTIMAAFGLGALVAVGLLALTGRLDD